MPPPSDSSRSGPSLFRLFGVTLATHHAFETELPVGEEPEQLTLSVVDRPSRGLDFAAIPPTYESPWRASNGEPLASFYSLPDQEVLRFAEGLDVYFSTDRVEVHVRRPVHPKIFEIHLLGTVLAYWLERSGLPVLHASAVDLGGRAVAFLADNRGGKSSLAAGCMQVGRALLTDDLLPVERVSHEMYGRSGVPQMRFWPEAVEQFWDGDVDDLPTVHPELDKVRMPVGEGGFGRFQPDRLPLAAIYLPRRRDDPSTEISIEPVSPAEALIELIRKSFIHRLAAVAGWEERRFGVLADLAEHVPVRRLVYPAGYERLPEVVERLAAAEDLSNPL